MSSLIIFLVTLFFFIALGIPIFMSLGLSSISIWVMHFGTIETSILIQKMFTGIDSFPLMAIPFFMLTGELMNTGGVSKRLVELAQSIIGWIKGGLGFAAIISSMLIAAILGSASASAAMIGMVMIPAMAERGYKKDFSAALIASSGSVGPIIPPSIPLIVYGVIAEVSIAKLFIGGYVPGVLMSVSFMIYTYYHARKNNYPAEDRPTVMGVFTAFRKAALTLMLPVIIMGGILGGVFTPTEAGVVSVVYALIVGMFIYKEIRWKDLKGIILRAANSSAMVLMVMSTAALLSWVLTRQQVPQTITQSILSVSSSTIIFLIIVNIFMVLVGMFLDAASALTILTPVLLPAALILDIDPVFFGVLLTVNLSIGVLTPPVGLNLFVTSSIANIDLLRISKAVIPFICMIFGILILMSVFPQIVTFLPNLFFN